MEPEPFLLSGIVQAADEITKALATSCRESFQGDDPVRTPVLDRLMVIGEAAAGLPEAFRESHPEVAWGAMIAFRDMVLGSAFPIEWGLVWRTATEDVPALSRQVAEILRREFDPADLPE
jgi:uncharacterized protein with HEPN domain